MRNVQYIPNDSTDCYYNLALEEYALTHFTEGDYLLLWQNDNTIVIGKNQNAQEEINHTFVEENAIHVVRRTTGGGAVYHDMGNVNFSFITDMENAERLTMEQFTVPIIKALADMGVAAETTGRNDITAGGKKISGNAQRIYKGRILHHGTLLFDSNMAMVSGALKVRPEKFRSKSAKSVRSRVINIRECLENDMGIDEFKARLIHSLTEGGLMDEIYLTETQKAEIRQLRDEKYATWEWNFGYSPKCNIQNYARYNGGTLDVRMQIEKGKIQSVNFYGDFMAVSPLDPLQEELAGCRYIPEEVRAILNKHPVSEYFGSILVEEILDCMFNL